MTDIHGVSQFELARAQTYSLLCVFKDGTWSEMFARKRALAAYLMKPVIGESSSVYGDHFKVYLPIALDGIICAVIIPLNEDDTSKIEIRTDDTIIAYEMSELAGASSAQTIKQAMNSLRNFLLKMAYIAPTAYFIEKE